MCHHPFKFDGLRNCGIADVLGFSFRVTLHNHVTKEFNDFMVRSSARYVNILPSLATIGTVAVEKVLSISPDISRSCY